MSLTIMKRIKFCAGHRLLGHESKCAFFHGHNYIADVYVTGQQVDEVGRLIDFSMLKQRFKGWIDDNWDHAFLLNKDDDNAINAIKMVEPSNYYVLPYNPTAENMARYLLEVIGPEVMQGTSIEVSRVVIWETEDSFAEASRDGHVSVLPNFTKYSEYAETEV